MIQDLDVQRKGVEFYFKCDGPLLEDLKRDRGVGWGEGGHCHFVWLGFKIFLALCG